MLGTQKKPRTTPGPLKYLFQGSILSDDRTTEAMVYANEPDVHILRDLMNDESATGEWGLRGDYILRTHEQMVVLYANRLSAIMNLD